MGLLNLSRGENGKYWRAHKEGTFVIPSEFLPSSYSSWRELDWQGREVGLKCRWSTLTTVTLRDRPHCWSERWTNKAPGSNGTCVFWSPTGRRQATSDSKGSTSSRLVTRAIQANPFWNYVSLGNVICWISYLLLEAIPGSTSLPQVPLQSDGGEEEERKRRSRRKGEEADEGANGTGTQQAAEERSKRKGKNSIACVVSTFTHRIVSSYASIPKNKFIDA